MLVIITTVITQGVRVPADLKGHVKGSLLFNDGFFQAIGVISFGNDPTLWPNSRHTADRRPAFVCRTLLGTPSGKAVDS